MAFFITTTIAGVLVTAFMLAVIRGMERKAATVDVEAAFESYLSNMRRVLAAGLRVFSDERATLRWVTSDEIPGFGQKTAAALVSEGRAEDVLRYLASIESKAG